LLDAELVRNEKQALTWPGGQTHQHTPRWHGRLGQSNSGPHIVSGTLGTSHYHPNQYVIGTTYGQARHGSWRRSLSRLRWASSSQWTSPRRGLAGRLVDLLVCPSVCCAPARWRQRPVIKMCNGLASWWFVVQLARRQTPDDEDESCWRLGLVSELCSAVLLLTHPGGVCAASFSARRTDRQADRQTASLYDVVLVHL
jgi:hypothetical protein